MIITVLIPFFAWGLFFTYTSRKGLGWRTAFLATSVAWGVALSLLTEFLSIFSALNRACLAAGWMVLAITSGVLLFRTGPIPKLPKLATLPRTDKFMVFSIVGILLCTFVIAVVSPPNNWDSMTYHMSRVMHWKQNQSVEHYPTGIVRQIELNPWAEFAITNLQILIGGDYLANLVQWFCMAGSILGVSLIAEKLGADRRVQIFAAVVAATIPMGILQSSSTQNDCVVSFWLVCLVYFGIIFNEEPCWSYALAVGASLGLAILTKGTAYIYAFPLSIWLAIYSLKSIKLMAAKYIGLILLIVISINIGHYIRNYGVFYNILSSGENTYSNEIHSLISLLSNITRNIALEAGSPFKYANHIIKSGVEMLHSSMELDINDQRTTWPGTKFDVVVSTHEDTVGNPFHVLLIISSIITVCCSKKLQSKQHVLQYLFAIVMAFILFCLYLKWQPWQNRLLLPLFILWSPIIALVMAEIKQLWATHSILIIICVIALPYLLYNSSRPIIPTRHTNSIFTSERNSQYFNNRPELMPTYLEIVYKLKSMNCSNIAIQIGVDSWEYPLWVLLQKEFNQDIHIEHVNVNNLSGKIPLHNNSFCQMVYIDRKNNFDQ